MTIAVALEDLRRETERRGDAAFLVTMGDAPHVVSARFSWRGDELVTGGGSRTIANIERSATVCVLWPNASFDDYSLIVDGQARAADGEVVVTPTKGVLHRSARTAGDGPSCVTVL